jgi:hypothetical protein
MANRLTRKKGKEDIMKVYHLRSMIVLMTSLLGAVVFGTILQTPQVYAASHREAPLIALDPTADITDVYMFRDYSPGNENMLVLIMNVIPAEEPSSGPNYFNFNDDVLYEIHLDTDQKGTANDIVFQFRFTTQIRSPFNDLPVSYAGVNTVTGLPPAITALNGTGSEGLGLRQSYTVTMIKEGKTTKLNGGNTFFAVPSNLGPRTMPDYEALAAQGVFNTSNGGLVFAGQRDDTFYIDLGATFDTLNFRRSPPILTVAEDANDGVNPFGFDMFSGFNVNTIAIEVPISEITNNPNAVIGAYASTSRSGKQVARMGNPLVNELIIGTGFKDKWNATAPIDEKQFLGFYQTPNLAALLKLAFGVTIPATPRTDLIAALLKYPNQSPSSCTAKNPCSELLRLNLATPPTPAAQQARLTVLAHDAAGNPTPDPAGWPNGRRPNDDVTDIALRVVAGGVGPALAGTVPLLGDGVNFNIGAPGTNVTANGISMIFPFLPTPFDGRDRVHINPTD